MAAIGRNHPGYYLDTMLINMKPIVIYREPVDDISSAGVAIEKISKLGQFIGMLDLYVLRNNKQSIWFYVIPVDGDGYRGWVRYEKGLFDGDTAVKYSSGKALEIRDEENKKKQEENSFGSFFEKNVFGVFSGMFTWVGIGLGVLILILGLKRK